MNNIAKRLKELRIDSGLSQNALGIKLNVSQDTISLWENNKSLPAVEYVILLARLYNVTSDYILCLIDY